MTQITDKMSLILVGLEMINNLSKSTTTREDIEETRAYIRSIENVIPIEIIIQLYEIIAHFEIFQHHFNNKLKQQ